MLAEGTVWHSSRRSDTLEMCNDANVLCASLELLHKTHVGGSGEKEQCQPISSVN